MLRTAWRLSLVPLALVLGVTVLPASAPADAVSPFRHGDYLAVNTHGTAKNESKSPNRTVFTFDLFSLATGQKIGTGVDDIFCSTQKPPPCAVFDAITTFHLPDGDIVNHAQVSVALDPQRLGMVIANGAGDTKTILPDKGKGAYAGRTGTVRMHGTSDGSRYPNELAQDDFWVIQLDPPIGDPDAGPAPAWRTGDWIGVNSMGTAKNVSPDPTRTVFTFDLYSLASGEKIGTVTDDVACSSSKPPPCAVFDAITTFHFPDGDLVNHAQVSVVPDSQKPGWFNVAAGGLDGEGTIVAGKGTGAYAGRDGWVRLRGTDDGRSYPSSLTLDDFWVIQLNS